MNGSGYTRVFFENPYPSLSKPAPLGADVGFREYGYSPNYLSTCLIFFHKCRAEVVKVGNFIWPTYLAQVGLNVF